MEQSNSLFLENCKIYTGRELSHSEEFNKYYDAFASNDDCSWENNDAVKNMLGRRLFLPLFEPQRHFNGLLLVGANPSYPKSDNNENFMKTLEELGDSDERHWKDVAALTKVQEERHIGAYLDLFPIKQSKLGEFERVFRGYNDIRARMLQITHERMVSLRPKVIVNLFAMTSYYWGFDNRSDDFCNKEHPWMGYKFKKIEAEGLDAYEIIGWLQDDERCMIPSDEDKRLAKGTIIIFSTKSWNKAIRESKMVTADKLKAFLDKNNIILGEE